MAATKTLPPEYKEIGHNIKLIRENRGLSVEQVANLVHCSSGHLKNIESGTSGISLELLILISNALDVYIEDIIYVLLQKKRPHLESKINGLLNDCSDDELKFFIELIKTGKEQLGYLLMPKSNN